MAVAADRMRSNRALRRARRDAKRKKTPRRRAHTVALPHEMGAEASLPALPVVRYGPRALTLILLVGWAFLAHRMWTSNEFAIRAAAVEGAELMSVAQVQSIAGLRGRSIFEVDPGAIERRLTSYAEIDAAEVQVSWPNQVTIDIQERRPIVEWDDGGATWWLSESGVAFIQRGADAPLVKVRAEQPVLDISQDALEPAIDPHILWGAVSLVERMPYAFDLSYSPEHGLAFDDPRGWRVEFGMDGDVDFKIEVYEAIADMLVDTGAVVDIVSVEDPSSPYYKLAR